MIFSSFPGIVRRLATLVVGLPLLVLAAAPGAPFVALAHASIPASGTVPGDVTLHYRSTIASLLSPTHMATDAQGSLYVADNAADNVSMYDKNDTFVRSFGTGTVGTGHGSFNFPAGIAVSGGSVFVVDRGNNQIQVFNQSTGAYLNQFGSAQLASPQGMALASNGELYVVDSANDRIARYSTAGTYLGAFSSFGAGNGLLNAPVGIAASPLGPVYVTDSGNKRIEEFSLGGAYVGQWGSSYLINPIGIAMDRALMLWVLDAGAARVFHFDANGTQTGLYGAPLPTVFTPGTFDAPEDVAVVNLPNTSAAVYVSDLIQGVVQRFDVTRNPYVHTFQSTWGSSGSANGQFSHAWNLATDSAGNVYVADSSNNRIEKFDAFGNFLLAWGGPGTGNGQLLDPRAIAITGSSVYVTDNENFRVQEFNTSGTYQRQWGSVGSGTGQFGDPDGIATDGRYVFVADGNNNRVEVFDLNGNYQWQWGSYGNGNGQFNDPVGIAADINRSEVFVTDYSNSRVEGFDTTGNYIATFGRGALLYPAGIATDQRGDVYVADLGHNQIYQFDVNGTVSTTFGTSGSGTGQFNEPSGVAVDPVNGQIYTTELNNDRVQRFGSPWPKVDTIGIYRPSTKTFYLRNSNNTGPANIVVPMPYAVNGDLPVVGDWNGDGVDTVGLYRSSTGTFLLQDANVQESAPDYTFTLGNPGDTPIAGDWSGSGHDSAGVFRPSNGILYLKNALNTGFADYSMVLGVSGDRGVAGDWNGDGQDSPGVYRPSNQTFYVTNKVTNGIIYADATAVLGISGDAPFTGDWVSQGSNGIGVFRPSNGITYEKNAVATGFADNNFIYGVAGDIPVAGVWVTP